MYDLKTFRELKSKRDRPIVLDEQQGGLKFAKKAKGTFAGKILSVLPKSGAGHAGQVNAPAEMEAANRIVNKTFCEVLKGTYGEGPAKKALGEDWSIALTTPRIEEAVRNAEMESVLPGGKNFDQSWLRDFGSKQEIALEDNQQTVLRHYLYNAVGRADRSRSPLTLKELKKHAESACFQARTLGEEKCEQLCIAIKLNPALAQQLNLGSKLPAPLSEAIGRINERLPRGLADPSHPICQSLGPERVECYRQQVLGQAAQEVHRDRTPRSGRPAVCAQFEKDLSRQKVYVGCRVTVTGSDEKQLVDQLLGLAASNLMTGERSTRSQPPSVRNGIEAAVREIVKAGEAGRERRHVIEIGEGVTLLLDGVPRPRTGGLVVEARLERDLYFKSRPDEEAGPQMERAVALLRQYCGNNDNLTYHLSALLQQAHYSAMLDVYHQDQAFANSDRDTPKPLTPITILHQSQRTEPRQEIFVSIEQPGPDAPKSFVIEARQNKGIKQFQSRRNEHETIDGHEVGMDPMKSRFVSHVELAVPAAALEEGSPFEEGKHDMVEIRSLAVELTGGVNWRESFATEIAVLRQNPS